MPADPSIYGLQVTPKFNSFADAMQDALALRTQQENARGLKEQREMMAAQRREQTEKLKRDNDEAAAVRGLFTRPNQPPTIEELSGVIGPTKAADVFKGFEAVKTARAGNAKADVDRIASVLGGLEALPEAMRADAYAGALKVFVADGTMQPGQAPAAYDPHFIKAKRREALTALQQFEQDKPPADYTLGDSRMSGATNQPITTAAPKAAEAGSFPDFVQRFAAARKLDPAKLSDAQVLAAKRQYAAASQAPERPDKPTYEWAQTSEGTRLLTPAEIRAQGATKPITATDKGKYKNAEPVLDAISELSEKINTGQGVMAKMGGGAVKLAAKANYDDDVAEFQSLVSGFTPLMARALGHTGVLTQQDVDSVKELFPRPGDSKSLRDRKISRVRDIFNKLEGDDGATKPGTAAPAGGRVRVKGPNGETGTMPASSALPPGWSKIGG